MSADLVAFLNDAIADDERECAFNGEPESWCDRCEQAAGVDPWQWTELRTDPKD